MDRYRRVARFVEELYSGVDKLKTPASTRNGRMSI